MQIENSKESAEDYEEILSSSTHQRIMLVAGEYRKEVTSTGKLYECADYLIYNRWGQLVYWSSEREPRWYGRNAVGLPVTNGTYFYKLEIQNEEVTGTINIFY